MCAVLGDVLLSVKEVSKTFQDREILHSMTFTLHRGHRIGIIGANGAGKSTFMKILAGRDTDHMGEVNHAPNTRVGYIPQEPELDPTKTVLENIEEGVSHIRALVTDYEEVATALGTEEDADTLEKLTDKLGRLQDQIDVTNAWELDYQLERAMEALRTPPGEAAVTNLSGGEKRRTALCRELMGFPDLLILDEPTNHLDAATVEWLELFIDEYPGTVVMVTHDRYFLDNVTDFMVEIDDGRLLIYEGNYSDYLEQKADRLEKTAKSEARRQNVLRRELEWLRATPKARTSKNKARIKNYQELASAGPQDKLGEMNIMLPVGPRLGDRVLSMAGVSKTFDDKLLFENLDLTVKPGEIIGITGPNGTGKTTLLSMISGEQQPDAGTIEMGETVEMIFCEQNRETLNADLTVFEEVSEGGDDVRIGDRSAPVREYLSRFGFRGSLQQTKVGRLSGGERNRLLLAKSFKKGANLLLLDEPTNDLDVSTLRLLEEALDQFAGSAIVVSHDRYFLDRLVTAVLVFEEGRQPRYYDGTFEDYFEARKSEEGETLGKRRRSSYRRLART